MIPLACGCRQQDLPHRDRCPVRPGLIEDNYIHDLGYNTGDHLNGTRRTAALADDHRHNTILDPYDQTDAISLFEDFGAQAQPDIDNNLVAGGGYTVYGDGGPRRRNIRIVNNRFPRMYSPNSGLRAGRRVPAGSGRQYVGGNIWDDTGAPVSL